MTEKKTVNKKTTKPAERKVTETEVAVERERSIEERLAGVPALTPPERLRLMYRNELRSILLDMERQGVFKGKEGTIRPEKLEAFMEALGRVDEFAHRIAVDADEYLDWSLENGDNIDAFTAILEKYADALGK